MKIEINKLKFGYDELLFDDFNLTIHSNTFTSIIGKNGCGKSSLVKLLIGDLDYSGEIKYNNLVLDKETKENIRRNIGVIFSNYSDMFISDNVYEDIEFSLEKNGYITSIIKDTILLSAKELGLTYLLYKKTNELSDSDKQLAMLLCMIVYKPNVLILDNSLNNIEYKKKKEIIAYLKNQDMTIINVTDNVEDILLSDNTILINNKKCITINNYIKLSEKEDQITESNLKLPFMIDLSKKLMYYDLIDKIVIDKNKLVDNIWK